jgi:hypothetical protein
MESGIRIADEGISLGRTLGARRLKALLLLSRHPELDDANWSGSVQFHFGGHSVKAAVHPSPTECT